MVALLAMLACDVGPATGWSAREAALISSLSPIPPPPPSPSNAVADDPAAAALGRALFFSPALSADNTVSCASCHDPARHFTDGKATATTSFGTGKRNVPTIETAPWQAWLFWDGRADSAWSQATGPLLNPIEHNLTAPQVQAVIAAQFAEPYTAVFGPLGDDPQRVLANVGKAIEAYERTIQIGPSRFDRFAEDLQAGKAEASTWLTPQEQAGLRLFIGDAGCVNCHNGPLFTDYTFHNLGLPIGPAGPDAGRATGVGRVLQDPFNCRGPYSDAKDCAELRYLDPSFPDWAAGFKTPTLRNASKTAPYMHDGSMTSLAQVLQFYNTLPGQPLIGHRELTLRPLQLSQAELEALEAFVRSLESLPAEGRG